MLILTSKFARFEGDLIRARTVEGLAKSRRAGGRRPGKVSALNADQRRELLSDHESGDYSIRDLMRKYPLGRSAIYSLIKRERNSRSTPTITPSAERRDATK
jgi:DNA invertase Pin-like site-specific DNA recombinase